MEVGGREKVRFGDFEFDLRSGKLFRGDRPVKIQPQPLRVLAVLLESAGEIVSRESLRSRVWGDATFVEFDQGLNYCIRQIRIALRDGASKPLYIETLPKQGYRFIAPVTLVTDVAMRGGNRFDAQTAAPDQFVIAPTDSPAPAAPDPRFPSAALACATRVRMARGLRRPGGRRRGSVFFLWLPSGCSEVHPAHGFYRFGARSCPVAGRAHGRVHPGRQQFSDSRSNLCQGAPQRRSQAPDGRHASEIQPGVHARWDADRLYGSAISHMGHIYGFRARRRLAPFSGQRGRADLARPAPTSLLASPFRATYGNRYRHRDRAGVSRPIFPVTPTGDGALLLGVSRSQIGFGEGDGRKRGLGALPADFPRRPARRQVDWTARPLHLRRLVTGWIMDVLHGFGGRDQPPVAPALSRWKAGANHVRPDRSGRCWRSSRMAPSSLRWECIKAPSGSTTAAASGPCHRREKS